MSPQAHPPLPAPARLALQLGVLGAHAAALWNCWPTGAPARPPVAAAPISVSLIHPAPVTPPPPPPPPASTGPAQRTPPQPDLPHAAHISATEVPTPAAAEPRVGATEDAASQPLHAEPAAPVVTVVAEPQRVPVTAAPEPRQVPLTAVRYREPPQPAYPAASRRLGEAGEVHLQVEIDTEGRPRQVRVLQSSGFPRLDRSALAAVQAARFEPFVDGGVAQVVWTLVPIAFELQANRL